MFPRTPINLTNTQFQLKSVVDSNWNFTCLIWKNGVISMPDFGTVLVEGHFTEEDIEWVIGESSPIFLCPPEWRMPQLLRALGAFESATGAAKNGWDREIGKGLVDNQIRINKIKGIITTFKGIKP